MKIKAIILSSFLFVSLVSISQGDIKYEISVNNVDSKKQFLIRKVVGFKDNIYMLSYKKASTSNKVPNVLHTYSSDNKLLKKQEIVLPNNSICYDLLVLGDDLFIAYGIKNKKKEVKYFRKNINSLEDKSNELLLTIPFNKYKKDLEIKSSYVKEIYPLKRDYSYLYNSVTSKNNKFWLLPNAKQNTKNNKLIVDFKVVSNDLSKTIEYNEKINIEDENSKIIQELIDDEGNIIFLINTIKNSRNNFRIFRLSQNKKLVELEKFLIESYLVDIKLAISKDGNLIASGFYSNTLPRDRKLFIQDQSYEGIFYAKLDYKSNRVIQSTIKNIEKEEEFDKEKKEWAYNKSYVSGGPSYAKELTEILENENGEIALIYTKYKNNPVTSTGGDRNSTYSIVPYACHVIILKENGEFKWVKNLDHNTDGYKGFAFLQKNNKLYFIYKAITQYGFDKENTNIQELNLETKQLKENAILSGKDYKWSFPESNAILSNNRIVFFTFTKGMFLSSKNMRWHIVEVKN